MDENKTYIDGLNEDINEDISVENEIAENEETVEEDIADNEDIAEEETAEDEEIVEEDTADDEETVEEDTADDEETAEEEIAEDEETVEEDAAEDEEIVEEETADDEEIAEEDIADNEEIAEEETAEDEEIAEEVTAESEETDSTAEAEIIREPKEKKPNKFAIWVKAHKLLVSLLSLLILVVAGAVAAHFIITKDMIFVRNPENLTEALAENKGEILVIKKDTVVSSDVTFGKAYEINLCGNTLSLEGKTTFALGDAESIVKVHTDKKKLATTAGKLIVNDMIITAPKSSFEFVSSLQAKSLDATWKNGVFNAMKLGYLSVNGSVKFLDTVEKLDENSAIADIHIANAQDVVDVMKPIDGKFTLANMVNLNIADGASASSVTGGAKVYVGNGATVSIIEKATKATIAPTANVGAITEVATVVLQEKLATPERISIVKSNGELNVTITKVLNAEKYSYTINDGEARTTENESFSITDLQPGNYTLRVFALSSNEKYVQSDVAETNFDFSVTLSSPTLQTAVSPDGKTYLQISHINNADFFKIYIRGTEYTAQQAEGAANTTFELSQYIANEGSYAIIVVACSNFSYYTPSDEAQCTWTTTSRLQAIMPQLEVMETSVTVSFEAVENAKYYEVSVTYAASETYPEGRTVTYYYTNPTTITLTDIPTTLDAESNEWMIAVGYSIKVKAVGHGYFEEPVL